MAVITPLLAHVPIGPLRRLTNTGTVLHAWHPTSRAAVLVSLPGLKLRPRWCTDGRGLIWIQCDGRNVEQGGPLNTSGRVWEVRHRTAALYVVRKSRVMHKNSLRPEGPTCIPLYMTRLRMRVNSYPLSHMTVGPLLSISAYILTVGCGLGAAVSLGKVYLRTGGYSNYGQRAGVT